MTLVLILIGLGLGVVFLVWILRLFYAVIIGKTSGE
jgi:hypothetical protein